VRSEENNSSGIISIFGSSSPEEKKKTWFKESLDIAIDVHRGRGVLMYPLIFFKLLGHKKQ
jgi:hypothetical protein